MNDLQSLQKEVHELKADIKLMMERQQAAKFRGQVGMTMQVLMVFGKIVTLIILYRFVIP